MNTAGQTLHQWERVLITGGTGYFGQAMTDYLLQQTQATIVIFSRGELLQQEMAQRLAAHTDRLRFFIGDVRDASRLTLALHGVDHVFHAAALKHVSVGEYNPDEMVKTNIYGTMNLIQAARDACVKRVVLISTDKSVQAINTYGKSKGIAEHLMVQGNGYAPDGTEYCCVRYGNVSGSRGSVIPIWQRCLREGLPLPVTDLSMSRFFISIQEALALAISAMEIAPRGGILVPYLPAYTMGDLLDAVCPEETPGASPPQLHQIPVRPGEKYHEDLLTADEASRLAIYSRNTRTPIYYCVMPSAPTWDIPAITTWPVIARAVSQDAGAIEPWYGMWHTGGLDVPYNSGTWMYRLSTAQLQQRLAHG